MIIDTKILTAPIFKEGYGMSKLEAFVWMLENSDKESKLNFSNKTYSIVFGWHRNKVSRFFEELALLGYVGIVRGHTNICISITCNRSCAGYVGIVKEVENQPENQPLEESKLLFEDEPEKEKKQLKKSPTKPKKEPTKVYSRLIKVYYEWYQSKNDGLPPNIGAIEGSFMNKLIDYFSLLVHNKQPNLEKGSEIFDDNIVLTLEHVLNDWDKQPDFIRSGVTIRQIYSNITNIINNLKNGAKKQQLTKQEQREAIIAKDRAEWTDVIDKLNNPQ